MLDKKDEKDDIDLSSIKGFTLKWYLGKLKIKNIDIITENIRKESEDPSMNLILKLNCWNQWLKFHSILEKNIEKKLKKIKNNTLMIIQKKKVMLEDRIQRRNQK